MADLRFEWDDRKKAQNWRKHRISFEEGLTVFYDEDAIQIDDPDSASGEERFLMLGLSSSFRTLVVCHCYRHGGDVIRIISARRATPREREQYGERWKQ